MVPDWLSKVLAGNVATSASGQVQTLLLLNAVAVCFFGHDLRVFDSRKFGDRCFLQRNNDGRFAFSYEQKSTPLL